MPLSFTGGVTYDALRLTGKLEAYRSADKTEPSLNLRKVAFDRGFVISDNQGKGNCMFFAISEQLKLIKGMKFSDKELRKNVVRYLKDNPTLVSSIQCFPIDYSAVQGLQTFFVNNYFNKVSLWLLF